MRGGIGEGGGWEEVDEEGGEREGEKSGGGSGGWRGIWIDEEVGRLVQNVKLVRRYCVIVVAEWWNLNMQREVITGMDRANAGAKIGREP
jgi:hypothetical protein